MTVDEFRKIAVACDPYCSHYTADNKDRDYTVWHEFARIGLGGDNGEAEEAWRFQIDRFTREEADPVAAAIWRVLEADDRLTLPAHTILYEQDTGYIHHVFQVRGV